MKGAFPIAFDACLSLWYLWVCSS